MIPLRGYQIAAADAIMSGFNEFMRQLLVAATGAGKTQIFCEIVRRFQPHRSLVLCHREELIQQAANRLRSFGMAAEVEMADQHASKDARVIVGSVQSLMRDSRLSRWPRDHFGLLVADEAHHATSDSWQKVLRYFDTKTLGASATPERSDKRQLGSYFENIAFEIGLLDLIKQNWLSPIRVKTVPLSLDLRGVRTTAGDFNSDDLGHAIEPYLARIADVMVENRHRKILVFLPLIRLSQQFAAMCRERGIAAEHVDGQSTERAACLARFRRGETTLVSNAMLLTEGYDEPSIDCVVCLRPTKVRGLYSQIIGRGTRIWPGKDHLLVLDFLWLTEEHSLVKPAHLIAQDAEEADEITEALGGEGDLEEAQAEVVADRTRRLQERLRLNAKRSSRIFDAMEFAVGIADPDLADFVPTMGWHGDPVSPKQGDILARWGIDPASIRCKGQASAIIDKLFLRRDLGLATAKQVRWLQKLGHPHPELATFEEASAFLSEKFGRATA